MIRSICRFLQAVLFDLRFKTLVSRRIASIAYFFSLVIAGFASIGIVFAFSRTLLWDLSYILPPFLAGPTLILLPFIMWIIIMIPVRVVFEITLALLLIADKVSLISESMPIKD